MSIQAAPQPEPSQINTDFPYTISFVDPSDSSATPSVSQQLHTTPPEAVLATEAGTSSRGRVCTMSCAMAESVSQQDFYGNRDMHYMALLSICEIDYATKHDQHLELQERMQRPIVFLSEMMGDIMYLHQALKQPDSRQFVEAIIKEINGHVDQKHWQLVKRAKVPDDIDVLPSVWSMHCKRDLTTGAISKHKAASTFTVANRNLASITTTRTHRS